MITVYNQSEKKSTLAFYKLFVAPTLVITGHEVQENGNVRTWLAGGWSVIAETAYQTGQEIQNAVARRFC